MLNFQNFVKDIPISQKQNYKIVSRVEIFH